MGQSNDPDRLPLSGTLVVVGASLAGGTCIAHLRKLGHSGPIFAIDPDPFAPYDRPQLSKRFLTDNTDLEVPHWWCEECELVRARAVGLDIQRRTVQVTYPNGEARSFAGDAVVIATGAKARKLEIEPVGVLSLRSANDALRLRKRIESVVKRVTIIGAGSLGTEIASSLGARGIKISIVDSASLPLLRLLGTQMGMQVIQWMQERNVATYLNNGVECIQRNDDGWSVKLDSGEVIQSDLVVSAVGAEPNVEWLNGSGLALSTGLHCEASGVALDSSGSVAPGIFAAGDVASTKQADSTFRRDESWTSAQTQGIGIAETLLLGTGSKGEPSPPYFWTEQFGRKIQILGRITQTGSLSCVKSTSNGTGNLYRFDDGGKQLAWIAVNSPADFAMAMVQGFDHI